MRGKLLTVAAVVAALLVGMVGGTIARNIAKPTQALAAETVAAPDTVPPPIKDPNAPRPKSATKPVRVVGPCDSNTAAQRVVVSIAQQHLWLCAGHIKVYDTPVTTGMKGKATPTGQFRIEQKLRNQILNPETGELYPVRYWIAWDAPEYGFHDSDWQTIPYGSAAYATGGSHGCVHVPAAGIAKLWNWVKVGAAVTIA